MGRADAASQDREREEREDDGGEQHDAHARRPSVTVCPPCHRLLSGTKRSTGPPACAVTVGCSHGMGPLTVALTATVAGGAVALDGDHGLGEEPGGAVEHRERDRAAAGRAAPLDLGGAGAILGRRGDDGASVVDERGLDDEEDHRHHDRQEEHRADDVAAIAAEAACPGAAR